MKKTLITLALLTPMFAFAQTSGTSSTTAPRMMPKDQTLSTTTVACVQASLDKRENALIAGHDAYNTSVKAALAKRLEGLKTAWAQPTRLARTEGRQSTYKTFKSEMQTANTAMKTVRNGAWKTFETEAKACGVKGGTGETPSIVGGANITL